MSEFASTYDVLAPRYDDWASGVLPNVRPGWVRKIDGFVGAGERVVELGCGTGEPVGRTLADRYDYIGVDASPGMLARARRQVTGGQFVNADMETMSFEAASLGAVVAFYSIPHVPRERHTALFSAIGSWLRSGGVFVGSLHSHDEADDFEPDWLGGGPMRWSGFDVETNFAMLAAAGLDVVEHQIIDQAEPDESTIHPLFVLARKQRPDEPA